MLPAMLVEPVPIPLEPPVEEVGAPLPLVGVNVGTVKLYGG